jgi:hypothetical protein
LLAMQWLLVFSFFILSFSSIYANEGNPLHCEICGHEIKSGKVYEVKSRMRFNTDVYYSLQEYKEGKFGSLPQNYERQTLILGEKCGKHYEELIKDPPRGQKRKSVIKELLKTYLLKS